MTLFKEQEKIYLLTFLLSIYIAVLIRTTWISDDAAITLRTVLNFTHGFGPVFNITERVQAYTHPLWFLLISVLFLLIKNVFYSTIVLSIFFAGLAFYLIIFRLSCSIEWAIICALSLVLSHSFIDYSTSGLENPLSFCLLALFVFLFKKQTFLISPRYLLLINLIFSLIYLNRPDLILLVLPMLLMVDYRATQKFKNFYLYIILGFLPLIAWLIFSLIYYGFPFPNTAYAKINTGLTSEELFYQGIRYFLNSFAQDPITLILILFSIILAFKKPSALNLGLSLGIIIYFLYVLKIGGDFMSGRFFSVPLFASMIILANLPKIRISTFSILGVLIILVGCSSFQITLLSNSQYHNQEINTSGITDERGFYYQRYGLLAGNRSQFRDLAQWPDKYKYANIKIQNIKILCGDLGYTSIYDGPFTHFVDVCALAEPLLARLPADYNPNWHVGHYQRRLPINYIESIRQSQNLLADQNLKEFYNKLNIIIKSPLFSMERFVTILKMNLGQYSHLINNQLYTSNIRNQIKKFNEISEIKSENTPWDAVGNVILYKDSQLIINFRDNFNFVKAKWMDVSFDGNDKYEVIFEKNNRFIERMEIGPNENHIIGLTRTIIKLPQDIQGKKFDQIIIKPMSGDGFYSIGHFVIKNNP